MAYRADLARLHHLARLLERRDIAIGEVHHIDDAGGFRRIGHLARLAEILGQRLFAQHRLAGGNQRHGGRMVDAVGRDVGDRVEIAPVERRLQRGEAPRDLVVVGELADAGRIDIDGADDDGALDGAEAAGMFLRHPTGTEYQKPHYASPSELVRFNDLRRMWSKCYFHAIPDERTV